MQKQINEYVDQFYIHISVVIEKDIVHKIP